MPVTNLNDRWSRHAMQTTDAPAAPRRPATPPPRAIDSKPLANKSIALTPAEIASLKKRGVIGPGATLAAEKRQSVVINGAVAHHGSVRIAFVEVTPEMATAWLASNNHHNRNRRKTTVAAYATDMRNGAWLLNHQGIAFDAGDTLLDGQHRLAAIVESGVPQVMIVSTGWPAQPANSGTKTMDTVDRGLSRTVADLLGLQHGITDGRYVVMACNSIAQICVGDGHKSRKLSVDLVLKTAGLFKDGIQHAVSNRINAVGLRSASVLGAVAFAYAVKPKAVTEFYESIRTGAGLGLDHPALSLRNYLLGTNANVRTATKDSPLQLAHAVLTHAHAAIKGQSLSKLTVRGEAVEYFTELQRTQVDQVRSWLLPVGRAGSPPAP
jgi:hypothetical protein